MDKEKRERLFELFKINKLIKGGVYELRSRNLLLGVYDGDEGFIGLRRKFDSRYLFTEYLAREFGGTQLGYDTASPIRYLGSTDLKPLDEKNKQLFDLLNEFEKDYG